MSRAIEASGRNRLRFEALELRAMLTTLVDIDVDGDLDAVNRNGWYENADGRGNFVAHNFDTSHSTYFGTIREFDLADLDGDQDLDVVLANGDRFENSDETGDFVKHNWASAPESGQIASIRLTDIGHDGVMDVIRHIFTEDPNTSIGEAYRNDATGHLVKLPDTLVDPRLSTDVDGDGDLDWIEEFCAFDPIGNLCGHTIVRLHTNQGGDQFEVTEIASFEEGAYVELVDYDLDGRDDLNVHYLVSVNLLIRNEGAQFGDVMQTIDVGDGVFISTDIDDDGDLDRVWHEMGFGLNWTYTLGKGGRQGTENVFGLKRSEESEWLNVTELSDIGDIDGDGQLDFILSSPTSELPVWISGATKTAHIQETPAVIGDVNGDGLFNSSDLVALFSAGEYDDDLVGNSGYEEGDFNGDGDFDSSDLVFAFQAGIYVA